jgi:ribose/xylose/arabinose/galactoside ABC-type transport system permease subunit
MEHAKVIEANNISRKPSAPFLVILNALIFLCLLLPGLNPVGWILAIPITLVFVAISGVWHGIWVFLTRKLRLHNIIRCVGFVLPVLCLAALPYLGIEPDRPINKQIPAPSESGRFSALVTAESDGWNVEIHGGDGLIVHDEKTEFVPHLNVYWI